MPKKTLGLKTYITIAFPLSMIRRFQEAAADLKLDQDKDMPEIIRRCSEKGAISIHEEALSKLINEYKGETALKSMDQVKT